jgi:YidC/Oxa1 family membrane protein insertase
MADIWRDLLVEPLLNVLILLYNTLAFGNLGVAVIELTVLLRLALFPLTFVDEKKKAAYAKLDGEVARVQQAFKNDEVAAHEQVRELLAKHRVDPWAKTAVLLIQLLVLLVLYRVFLNGINANLGGLYSWVPHPQMPINTLFFGFDIGTRSLYWAMAVGIMLYLDIVAEQREVEHLLGKQDAVFRYAFPIMTVVVLSLLPMVKAVFILTSMVFSMLISALRRWLWPTASTN